jgi:hypothetical protein
MTIGGAMKKAQATGISAPCRETFCLFNCHRKKRKSTPLEPVLLYPKCSRRKSPNLQNFYKPKQPYKKALTE